MVGPRRCFCAANPVPVVNAPVVATGVERWLCACMKSSCVRLYGTFVVTAAHVIFAHPGMWETVSSQIERVESLTGTPRTTFRRDDDVVTFLPDSRTVVQKHVKRWVFFPNLLNRAGRIP